MSPESGRAQSFQPLTRDRANAPQPEAWWSPLSTLCICCLWLPLAGLALAVSAPAPWEAEPPTAVTWQSTVILPSAASPCTLLVLKASPATPVTVRFPVATETTIPAAMNILCLCENTPGATVTVGATPAGLLAQPVGNRHHRGPAAALPHLGTRVATRHVAGSEVPL